MSQTMSRTTASTLPSDHPGIDELYGLLAYGQLTAFYRLAEDAAFAPDLSGKVAMARLAAADVEHFDLLCAALRERGADPEEAMAPFAAILEGYHASTAPAGWLEALVKAYLGDGLAADFHREIAAALPAEVREVVRRALADTGMSEFVVAEVRAALAASAPLQARLSLWGRRLLGEAITQAQHVAAQRDGLAELVLAATGDLSGLGVLIDRLQAEHTARMESLGLG